MLIVVQVAGELTTMNDFTQNRTQVICKIKNVTVCATTEIINVQNHIAGLMMDGNHLNEGTVYQQHILHHIYNANCCKKCQRNAILKRLRLQLLN